MKSKLVKWTLAASLATSAFGLGAVASPSSNVEVAQAAYTMFSITDGVNVRSGPGTGYRVLGQLTFNDPISVISKYNSTWSKISYKGKTAYVSNSWIASQPNVQEYYTVNTGGANLNVRSGPGTSYGILFKKSGGSIAAMLNKTNSKWYRIWGGGSRVGYVSAAYLEPLPAYSVQTEGVKLYLRTGPGSAYKKIRTLTNYEILYAVNVESSRWFAVAYADGKIGYVNAKYLTPFPY